MDANTSCVFCTWPATYTESLSSGDGGRHHSLPLCEHHRDTRQKLNWRAMFFQIEPRRVITNNVGQMSAAALEAGAAEEVVVVRIIDNKPVEIPVVRVPNPKEPS